ncbi:probable prolyl 4-hydroxylase 6 isoform X1 [Ananas comosus]|uniref:procollagen-proline 4-dioxygenase n=1 Tax=Ananas comosus TaxID=4615 RepID=A0A6P5FSL4_ANACO|nr:probable prolyl 4-hydroxylase 6 isoform X1 [Ananas comosus]
MALFFAFLVLVSLPTLLVARSEPTFYDPARVSRLSWRPRAFLYRGFVSHEECDHLIELAKDKLEKSMVADDESGDSVASDIRTSSGMFLEKHQDEIVARIEQRIAAWTFLPEENGEAIQILRYENGQKYDEHFDYFNDKNNQALGGHRVATVLMYLSDVKKGGETVFPDAEGKLSQHTDETWSECARSGYAVKPKKGDALLFFSLHVDATTDPSSLHASCPVIEGEKWSATKWIHVHSFDDPPRRIATGECSDENALCPRWAAAGECMKNPLYMVGTEEARGFCLKSCGMCDPE